MAASLRTSLLLLLFVASAGIAQAQDPPPAINFRATAVNVAEGATNVALNTTLTFTIEPSLPGDDVLAEYELEDLADLVGDVGGDLDIQSASVNSARTEISYEVQHTADTDYALVFFGYAFDPVTPTSGTFGFLPFTVNYTTSSTRASGEVSGELVLASNENVDPDFTNALVFIQSGDNDNGYVTVVGSSENTYTVTGVRDGSYFASAFYFFFEVVNEVTVAPLSSFGLHDSNGDNIPDAFAVSGSAVTDIDITMNNFIFSVDAEDEPEVPEQIALGQNYPNPFNPVTVIPFDLAEAGPVRLSVYNLLGQEVAVVLDGVRPAGAHEATFDASALPSGVYLYRLEAAGQVHTRTLTLMK